MTSDPVIWITLAAIALTAGTVLVRVFFARHLADIVLLLQILSAKVIAVFFIFSVVFDVPAFAEIALSIALLGAVAAAVFACRRVS